MQNIPLQQDSSVGLLAWTPLLSKLRCDAHLQDAEDEWETVPAKSRGRKHAAEGSAASSPNNCPHGKLAKAEAASSEDEAAPPRDALQAAQQQLGPAEGAPHPDAGMNHVLATATESA